MARTGVTESRSVRYQGSIAVQVTRPCSPHDGEHDRDEADAQDDVIEEISRHPEHDPPDVPHPVVEIDENEPDDERQEPPRVRKHDAGA